jgi:hypothetical protein
MSFFSHRAFGARIVASFLRASQRGFTFSVPEKMHAVTPGPSPIMTETKSVSFLFITAHVIQSRPSARRWASKDGEVPGSDTDELSREEIEARMSAGLKRALATPPASASAAPGKKRRATERESRPAR